jgi:hypothetical protein
MITLLSFIASVQLCFIGILLYYIHLLKMELKSVESSLGLIDDLTTKHLQSVENISNKVLTIQLNRESRSPAESFKDPPKFRDEDKSSW